jgi:hypothetical protein
VFPFLVVMALGATIQEDYVGIPAAERPHIYYLTIPAGSKNNWPAALALGIAQNSRATVLNRHLPVKISEHVYRINLRELKWLPADFEKVLKAYPYRRGPKGTVTSIVVRSDWLLTELSDSSESTAYQDLLFSGLDSPKTIQDWYKGLGIDQTQARKLGLDHGLIEMDSGVARHRQRLIEFLPSLGGYDSTTDDVDTLVGKSPLEFANPADFRAKAKFASEHIVGLPKFWHTTKDGKRVGGRGAMSVFALSNAKGELQKEAPTGVDVDHSLFRGHGSIRLPGGCLSCHRNAYNNPTRNGLKELFDSGVELYAKDAADAELIERFHLTDESEEISRANKLYAGAVQAATGLTPALAIGEYLACIKEYDSDLTPVQAAVELGVSEEDMKLAIASQKSPGANLSALAAGKNIAREVWEGEYLKAYGYTRRVKVK